MLPNKLIEALAFIKENGCGNIKCKECPLNKTNSEDQDELCIALFHLTKLQE